jgi:hypothetical protein
MKNIEKVLILGGLGYGVYYAITNLIGKKDEGTSSAPSEQPSKAIIPVTARTYEEKVGELQALLGVAIDMKVGKQTNGTLENLYTNPPTSYPMDTSFKNGYPNLKKNGKGVISESNINFYIDALRNKTYPVAKNYASQDAVKEANLIYNAYLSKGVLKVKKDSTFDVVNYDSARKVYVSSGKRFTYKANASFITPESFARTRVKILKDFPNGWLIVDVAPIDSSPYKLKVNPFNVYVG